MTEKKTYLIELIETDTGRVVAEFTTVSLRAAERMDRGLNINLDSSKFYTNLIPDERG